MAGMSPEEYPAALSMFAVGGIGSTIYTAITGTMQTMPNFLNMTFYVALVFVSLAFIVGLVGLKFKKSTD
jgi:hypothetical protein